MHIKAKDTDSGRYYPWKDDKYVSVTTVIGEGIPKPGLNKWFVKRMAEVAADNRKDLAKLTKIEAKDWLMDQRLSGGDDAALLGTRIHSMCEKKVEGKEVRPPTETEKPFMDGFDAFLADHEPVYLLTESTVFSRIHGYAGTLDAVATIGGKTYVIDIKTGKRVWPEAALQMAAYRYADFVGGARGREDSIPPCHGGLVLHLRPEGYEVLPVDTSESVFDTFLSALDIFRWNRIDSEGTIGKPW